MSLLTRYRERLQNEHGWQVELECSQCGHVGLPKCDGWTPSNVIRLGDKPTIYANVTCPECGKSLKDEAGHKLVELFSGVVTSAQNKRLLYGFVLVALVLPLILFAVLYTGFVVGWWGNLAFVWLNLVWILATPAILVFNYKVASIRFICECGKPHYLFMGLLGRSCCYRCSTCGRLLRLRD